MTREELNKKKQKKISNEVNRSKRKKIILFFFKILMILIAFFGLFYLFNKYIFTNKIIVKEERISNEKIPDSFNGTKIVQFSDLHYGSTFFMDKVKEIVKLINVRNPDLIFFTGDLIDKNYTLSAKEQEELILELSKLNASIGKYAIIGDEDKDSFLTVFNQSDFTILNNDFDLVYNDSETPILLVGISSKLQSASNVDKAFSYFNSETYNSDIYTITLIHEPDLADDIVSFYHSDLILAGHSHNGNIRSPWGTPYKIDGAYKYIDEYYSLNNSELYISSGLGTKDLGIRFLCLPSVNFFRLSNK